MKSILAICMCLLLGQMAFGQKTWEERLEEMEARIKAKQNEQQSRIELGFANQMRRVWAEAELHGADIPKLTPKPIDRPTFDPANTPIPKNPNTEILIVPAPQPANPRAATKPKEAAPLQPKSALVESKLEDLEEETTTTFFGEELSLRFDPKLRIDNLQVLSEQRIADAWLQLDAAKSELLVYQLERAAAERSLNDWGFLQLVNKASKRFFPRDKNAQTLFNWFMAVQAGYTATAAYDRDRLYLLMPTDRTLYGLPYLKGKEGVKFYAIDLDGDETDLNSCRIFNGKHPEAKRVVEFDIPVAPKLTSRMTERDLSFDYAGENYEIPVTVNRTLVKFYATMPFFDLDLYLQTPLSTTAMKDLEKGLKPILAGRPQTEQVDIILRFVQTGFAYQTDQQQFGKERYLFAEETLFYPFSDCEDRSVLFSTLVQNLVGLEVVGLVFPGHAATAVRFSEAVSGDRITYQGKVFTICDPTYINAKIGMLLPDARNKQAKVIAGK